MRELTTIGLVVLLTGCSATHRVDKPVSRNVANRFAPIALPSSASNAYYVFYADGMQDLERYLRFDCGHDELDPWVEEAIRSNQTKFARSLPYQTVSIAAAPVQKPGRPFAPVLWWTPSSITDGYYRGEIDSYALRIWVDNERNRIYLYQND